MNKSTNISISLNGKRMYMQPTLQVIDVAVSPLLSESAKGGETSIKMSIDRSNDTVDREEDQW